MTVMGTPTVGPIWPVAVLNVTDPASVPAIAVETVAVKVSVPPTGTVAALTVSAVVVTAFVGLTAIVTGTVEIEDDP